MIQICNNRFISAVDRDAGSSQTFPVFAPGVTHRGPHKNGPGEINVPIAIDGMVIKPGDLILALQLHLIEGSESMGDHDSGSDDWWCVG